MCREIKTGIHTYSLYHKTPYTEAKNLIELLKECGCCYTNTENDWGYDGTYISDLYADFGVEIYIYRYYSYSGFSSKITPCSLLKESYAAEMLYQPTSPDNWELMNKLNNILTNLEVKSDSDEPIRAHDMSVCRADPCINFYLDSIDEVLEYLRILKKSDLIPHYNIDKFKKTSLRTKNIEEVNNHSYRIKSKKAQFTAYDKTYQMQQNPYCSEELENVHILRIEAELKRDALLKRLDKNEICSEGKILEATARDAVKILTKFLKKMQIGTGDHIRYCDAEMAIKNSKLGAKMRDRMLYLIRKVSDSNLSSALEKLCKKYTLTNNQCERILDQFNVLGISPITLRNNSKFSSLPSLISLLQEDQQSIPKRDMEGFIILEWKDPCRENSTHE